MISNLNNIINPKKITEGSEDWKDSISGKSVYRYRAVSFVWRI